MVDAGGSLSSDFLEIRYADLGINVTGAAAVGFGGSFQEVGTAISSEYFVDATNVDWGDPSGPGPYGTGYAVSGGGVLVVPWIGWVPPPVPPPPPPPPPPADPECFDVVVLGARGSDESPQNTPYSSWSDETGLGSRVGLATSLFVQRLNELEPTLSVTRRGVRYPALGVKPLDMLDGDYIDSIYEGVSAVKSMMREHSGRCPATKFVLAGYSQGALAIHLALENLSLSELDAIAAVILIADPAKHSNVQHTLWEADNTPAGTGVSNADGIWTKAYRGLSPLIPSSLNGRTIEICHNNDAVCAPGFLAATTVSAAHISYGGDGELDSMGHWAAEIAASYID